MAIIGDGRAGVFCGNSLQPPASWEPTMQKSIPMKSFDVVLTNPPFGTKIKITAKEVLQQYDLARRFSFDRLTGRWEPGDTIEQRPPQLLFIERCLQLLNPGGRLGIVLPESILGMPTYTWVVQYLRRVATVLAVVSMPEDLFQPHTHAKTCVVVIRNSPPPSEPYPIFMSVVQWCGHDSRGNPTVRRTADGKEETLDDVPMVAEQFRLLMPDVWA